MESFVNIVIIFIFSIILFLSRKNKINVCNNILIEKIYKKWYRKNAKEFNKKFLSNNKRNKLYADLVKNFRHESISIKHLKYHIKIIEEDVNEYNKGIRKVMKTFLGFLPIGIWIQSIIRNNKVEDVLKHLKEDINSGYFGVILIIFSLILACASCYFILNIDVANRDTHKKYILKDTVKIWNRMNKKNKQQ